MKIKYLMGVALTIPLLLGGGTVSAATFTLSAGTTGWTAGTAPTKSTGADTVTKIIDTDIDPFTPASMKSGRYGWDTGYAAVQDATHNPLGGFVSTFSDRWNFTTSFLGDAQFSVSSSNVSSTSSTMKLTAINIYLASAPSTVVATVHNSGVNNDATATNIGGVTGNRYNTGAGNAVSQTIASTSTGWGQSLVIPVFTMQAGTSYILEVVGISSNKKFVSGSGGAGFYSIDAGYTAAPIPGAVWLFGSGIVGLLAASKRKKATTAALQA